MCLSHLLHLPACLVSPSGMSLSPDIRNRAVGTFLRQPQARCTAAPGDLQGLAGEASPLTERKGAWWRVPSSPYLGKQHPELGLCFAWPLGEAALLRPSCLWVAQHAGGGLIGATGCM